MTARLSKSRLRQELRRTRVEAAGLPEPVRRRRDDRLLAGIRALVSPGGTVCAFVPSHGEIGSPELPVVAASVGARVLLPVVPDAPGPLDWALFTSAQALVPGRFGIPVPGPAPGSGGETTTLLGPAAVTEADLVLVPALAVDRRGGRLGRGGGYYDRTLPLAGPGTRLVAVVDSSEVVAEVPTEDFDVRVHAALTPEGLLEFG